MQGKNEIEAQNRLSLLKQAVEKIGKQINDRFRGNQELLKLLAELNENSVLIESLLDESKENEQIQYLAQAGKKLLEELEQKIKAQNRNVAAFLGTEFKKINDYYLPFLLKEKQNTAVFSSNTSSQSMSHISARRDIHTNQAFHDQRSQTTIYSHSAITHGNYSPATVITSPLPPSDKLPEMWNIPPRNRNFTGREELLKKITEHFNAKETKHLVLTAHGLGGIGKTQLTLEYVWQHYKEYKGVCWFNSESREKLISEYISLGQELHLFAEAEKTISLEEKVKIVKTWLEHPSRAGWLLIYDSALKQDDINNLLPVKEGKILITSRHTYWSQYHTIAVSVFSLIDAQNYMKKIIGEQKFNEEAANQLIKLLGYLPLAIAQASAYIQQNGISIDKYIELYQKKYEALLAEQLLPEDEYAKSVSITWNITLDQMSNEAPESVELLYCCSYLHHEQIPESLLPYFFEGVDEASLELKTNKGKRIAKQYSMINVDEQKQTFSIHSLVQQIIRDQLIKGKKDSDYLLKGISALCNLYPYDKKQRMDFSLKIKLNPHLEEVLKYLDNYLNKLNLLNDEETKKLVCNLQKDFLLKLLIYLADVYSDFGNAFQSKKLLERTLAIAELHYGKEHVEVAIILNNLANAHGALGNAKEKKTFLERALAITELHHGKEHVEVAKTLGDLGNVYGILGDAEKQKKTIRASVKNI